MNRAMGQTAFSSWLFVVVITCRTSADPGAMVVHYIDVGQGAAALVEFPCAAILIDAGGQDDAHVDHLLEYVREFFQRRTDLNNTLQSIIITHQHVDHTKALQRVVETFNVKRLIENGVDHGSGIGPVRWVRTNAHSDGRDISVFAITDDQVTALPHKQGLTNDNIDPVACTPIDPKIAILSGAMRVNPGWSESDFDNGNNHSLVTRISFGDASFLFTGDLEDSAIETLVDYYQGTDTLDVDVYHVGHHGSYNGTTTSLLDAMSPWISVISMGRWDFGKGQKKGFNTYSFGHPRKVTVDMLKASVAGNRGKPKRVRVFTSAYSEPSSTTVRKAIYATGWDGDLTISATSDGQFDIVTSR